MRSTAAGRRGPVDLDDGGVEVAVGHEDGRPVLRDGGSVLGLDDRDDQVLGIDFRRRVGFEHAETGRRSALPRARSSG